MTDVKTMAVFTEPNEGSEFNYNREYAKFLSGIIALKLTEIERTTTSGCEMSAKIGESVSWTMTQKFVALATRFAQFNSFPKVTSALVGELQFPSITIVPNGVLTILNDGSGVLASVVDGVEHVLALLQSYFELTERTILGLAKSDMSLYEAYGEHRAVLAVIEKLLSEITRDGTTLPKNFQNLKLKLERHDYVRESGALFINLTVEL